MNLAEIIKTDKQYYMNTFGDRTPVCFTHGKGMKLYSTEGKTYYDFMGGIAVNALGHSHPDYVTALKNQAEKLIHTSSLYYIESQALLAQQICINSCADKVFFANSGAEANESAVKLAKIYHYKKQTGKTDIITLTNSFHGRTVAMVAATGQEKYQKPYKPLTPGFSSIPINDIEAFNNAVNDKTAAVMLELIQGESGVHPVTNEYIQHVANVCADNDILLIVDEIQTGMGRTGKLFAYELYGVEPDIFTLAKALGGGVPISAVCAKDFVASAFEPGDHGGTFGGNPFATSAGLAVFEIFKKENLVENSAKMGKYFKEELLKLSGITEVRGSGLMIGAGVSGNAKAIQTKMFERGFLMGAAGDTTLRILPPLIVTKEDIDLFVSELSSVLCEM